jgi:DNA-binding winged helix-turn-helix (wHTH) protein
MPPLFVLRALQERAAAWPPHSRSFAKTSSYTSPRLVRLKFGEITIDCDRRELTRRGEEVHLSAKAFAFLELLVECRPNAVRRQEIHDRVWPNIFVAESNIASLAQEIRNALDDDARRPRFLKTIFNFGYAFIGEEEETTAVRRLVIGSTHIDLSEPETIIGRRTPILAADPAISRDHARIAVASGRTTIEDLGSKNGTFVGGQKIAAPTELVDGDVIGLGSARLVFRNVAPAESTLTLPPKSDN